MSDGEAPPAAPAGWYPDPEDPSARRYWNGSAWIELPAPPRPEASAPEPPARVPNPRDPPPPHPRPQRTAPEPQPARSQWQTDPSNEMSVKFALLFSIIPLVGLIVGIVLVSRKDPRGFWAFGLAILGGVLYGLATSAGA